MADGDDDTLIREPSGSTGATARALLDAPEDTLTARYDVRGRLGKGGMGEVVDAFDRRLRRDVAVKILRVEDPDADSVRRFLREAQLTARLDHPHVPPVHDLGVGPDGSLFFSTKRVTGRTLAQIVKERELSLHQRLDVFLKVCDAVAYGHARGVLHRDIKPANVMVGAFREVYLIDWGLAKTVGDDESSGAGPVVLPDRGDEELTAGGWVLGTPGFMSPEQARGEHHLVDVRSDVYALGVLLYVLLVGSPPFRGQGEAALEQVRSGKFSPPSARATGVPRELEAVVLRAMAGRPAERHASVDDLRSEVQRFLEGQPLLGVRYTPVQRASKWAVRNRRPLAAAGSGLVVLGLVLVVVLVTNLAVASRGRDRALAAEARSQRSLADSEVARARAVGDLGRIDEALAGLDRAEALYRALGVPERKATVTRSVLLQRHPPPELTWRHGAGPAFLAAISAAGDRAALITAAGLRGYALPSGRLEWGSAVPEGQAVIGLGFGGGRPLAVMDDGMRAQVVDPSTATPVSGPIAHPARAIAFNGFVVDDGREVVVTNPLGGTWVHRVADGRPIGPAHDRVFALAVSADGRTFAGAVVEGALHRQADAVRVWDAATGTQVLEVAAQGPLALSSDGDRLVYEVDHELVLVDIADGAERWRAPSLAAARIAFARSDEVVVAVGSDQRVIVLDAATGRRSGERHTMTGLSVSHGRVHLAADGDRGLTVSDDAVRMWSVGDGSDEERIAVSAANLTAVDLSPDGLLAATAGWDGVVRLWEWRSRSLLREIPVSAKGTRDVAFSPDAALLLTADRDGAARVVETDTGRIVREFRSPPADLAMGAAFAGRDAVVLFEDGRVVAFDPATGLEQWSFRAATDNPWGLAVSSDGRTAAVTSRARTHGVYERWDLRDRTLLATGPQGEAAYRVAFSPDGAELLLGTHEGHARRFRVAGGTSAPLAARAEAIQAVGWSADGTLVATGGYDGQVDLYDGATAELLQSVDCHDASIVDLVFASDGTILTASGDGTLAVLDPLRWQRLGPSSLVLDPDTRIPEPDGARWLGIAEGAALRANWRLALDALDRAAADGASVLETDRARALWALGLRDEAREVLARALERGAGPSVRAWAHAP